MQKSTAVWKVQLFMQKSTANPAEAHVPRLAVNHHWTSLMQQNHLLGAQEKNMTAPADSTVTVTGLPLSQGNHCDRATTIADRYSCIAGTLEKVQLYSWYSGN